MIYHIKKFYLSSFISFTNAHCNVEINFYCCTWKNRKEIYLTQDSITETDQRSGRSMQIYYLISRDLIKQKIRIVI